jgi:methylation protein EvaC
MRVLVPQYIGNKMKECFLDLGKQPIANKFIYDNEINDEYFYNLLVCIDLDNLLVSLCNFVPPEKMFNDTYVYHSSNSITMCNHFFNIANFIQKEYNPKLVLEIGSNDGVFIRNFNKENAICIEPCGNFAKITKEMGYTTYNEFATTSLFNQIKDNHGKFNIIFSANCMCHIQNIYSTFEGIHSLLSDNGVFIMEDPSLLHTLQNNAYDQFYDEHAHIFSLMAIKNIAEQFDLYVYDAEKLNVHGQSNRIYISKKYKAKTSRLISLLNEETNFGITYYDTYRNFADNIIMSRDKLIQLLNKLKGKGIVSYGATSKSTTIFNYCNIGTDLIPYIIDTTPDKQGKLSPGTHIPVIKYKENWWKNNKYAFLGAWNYFEEIKNKEGDFINNGGKFITHVPEVRYL